MKQVIASQNLALAAGLVAAMTLIPFPKPILSAAAFRPPVTIGNGTGHLRYPEAQKALKLEPGDTLYIRPGAYLGLALGNLAGSAAAPITVVCDPHTVFTTRTPQPNDFTNIAHVRFENFRFVEYNSTCMRFRGQCHDVLFKNFCITNASGWPNRPLATMSASVAAAISRSSTTSSPDNGPMTCGSGP